MIHIVLCAFMMCWVSDVAWAGRPAIPEMSESEVQKLSQGKVVIRDDPGPSDLTGVQGLVEIAASREAIWDVLLDLELIRDANNSVKSLDGYRDEVGPDGTRYIGLHYVLGVMMTEVEYYTLREFHREEDYLTWALDPDFDSDVKATQGHYVLYPGKTPGTQLLVYLTRVDSGRKIPAWIQEYLTGRTLKSYLDFVKTASEEKR